MLSLVWLLVGGLVRGESRLSKVELFEQMRLARRDERLGHRALAERFGVHRRIVVQALAPISSVAIDWQSKIGPIVIPFY